MSKLSRTKGRAFEQRIARVLRAAFPDALVRRSSQADRAAQSDVYTNGAGEANRIWWELTDGRKPNVLAKLLQAERDVLVTPNGGRPYRLPVVVHHKLGERTTYATMRLETLDVLRRYYEGKSSHDDLLVTLAFGDFLGLLR